MPATLRPNVFPSFIPSFRDSPFVLASDPWKDLSPSHVTGHTGPGLEGNRVPQVLPQKNLILGGATLSLPRKRLRALRGSSWWAAGLLRSVDWTRLSGAKITMRIRLLTYFECEILEMETFPPMKETSAGKTTPHSTSGSWGSVWQRLKHWGGIVFNSCVPVCQNIKGNCGKGLGFNPSFNVCNLLSSSPINT